MDANTTGQIISTQLPWPISADWIIALAAIATLAVGMIIAWKQISIQEEQAEIARTQTQIARQQLAILDYQEQERRKEKGKAELKPQLIEHATTNVTDRYLLRIKNEGKARARTPKSERRARGLSGEHTAARDMITSTSFNRGPRRGHLLSTVSLDCQSVGIT